MQVFFSADSETEKDALLTDLSNIKPTNPRLLNKIYSCSSLGVQEKIISKFSNARSIQRVALTDWVSEQCVLNHKEVVEEVVMSYYKDKVQRVNLHINTFKDVIPEQYWYEVKGGACTTKIAYVMRATM